MLVRNTAWKQSSDPVRKALPDKITITLFTNADEMDNRLLAGDYDLDFSQTGLSPQARIKALKEHKNNLDNPVSGYIRYAVFPRGGAIERIAPIRVAALLLRVAFRAPLPSRQNTHSLPLGPELSDTCPIEKWALMVNAGRDAPIRQTAIEAADGVA